MHVLRRQICPCLPNVMSHQRKRTESSDYRGDLISSHPDQLPPARPNLANSDQSGVGMIQMHRQPAPPPRPPSARRRRPSSGRRASGVQPPSSRSTVTANHDTYMYAEPDPEPENPDEEVYMSCGRPPSSISSRPSSSLSKYNPLPPIGYSPKHMEMDGSDWPKNAATYLCDRTGSMGRLQMDFHVPSMDDEDHKDYDGDGKNGMVESSIQENRHRKVIEPETKDFEMKHSSFSELEVSQHASYSETGRDATSRDISTAASRPGPRISISKKINNTKWSEYDRSKRHFSNENIPDKSNNADLPKNNQSDKTKPNINVADRITASSSEQTELLVPPGETNRELKPQHILPPEPGEWDNRLLLAFKLPEGQRFQRYFRSSDSLRLVVKFVENSSGLNLGNFNLVCHSPKRIFTDLEQTLASSGLQDRTLLYLDEKD